MLTHSYKSANSARILIGYLLASLLIGLALTFPIMILHQVIMLFSEAIILLRILIISICLAFSYFLFGIILLLLIVGIKKALGLQSSLNDCTVSSLEYMKFEVYTALLGLAQFFFLFLTRSTFIINSFYRGMGAKVGKNTIINTTKIFDCNLIEIGDNCVIGGDCIINGHTLENGILKRGKVIIGDNVTVGTCTMILPGVIVENNVILGANSLVTKNKVLESNSTYAGIPVQKIGSHYKPEKILNLKDEKNTPLDSQAQLIELKGNVKHSDILLKLYERLSVEIVAFETLMANVFISSTGILFSIIIYCIVNNKPKVLLIIPPLIGIVSAFIVSTGASMLRAAFKKSQIEIFFQYAGVKYFNWETRYGELGNSRLRDLDGILIFIIYAGVWLAGLIFTFSGKLISKTDLFIDYPIYIILAIINGSILLWVIICLIFSVLKSKFYKRQLNELRNELNNTTSSNIT